MYAAVLSNNDKKNIKSRKKLIVGIISLILVFVAVLIAILYFSEGDRKVDMETGEVKKGVIDYTGQDIQESPGIVAPGYLALSLMADKRMQNTYLRNPKENTCYFKLSLVLKDGTIIWKSDYLEPGLAFDRIKLKKTLKRGTYEDTTLQYDCYSIVDKRKQNGASVKLTLNVY